MSARARPAAVLLDLEGTLYANGVALPGAASAVHALRERGWPLRFLTNIESRPPEAIASELAAMGLDVPACELFTPLSAARGLLAAAGEPRVYPLMGAALRDGLDGVALEPPYTHVVVGDCREVLGYPVLDAAFRAVRAGAELVALQRGRYFKRADGDHIDTGAVVAALEYATGVRAKVLGKPSVEFFELAARSLGTSAARCAVVGDDATTDIEGGRAAGATTVQVRTGKYADQTAEGLAGRANHRADHIVDSIADLPALLGEPAP